jgi:hypothetical protein
MVICTRRLNWLCLDAPTFVSHAEKLRKKKEDTEKGRLARRILRFPQKYTADFQLQLSNSPIDPKVTKCHPILGITATTFTGKKRR